MRLSRAMGIVLFTVLSPLWMCCGKDQRSPTSPTPAPAPPRIPPALTRISVSGNGQLTAIGATSQLTVNATLSDNTVMDVTGMVRWVVGDTRVVSISPTGLLTVTQFGATYVTATYQDRGGALMVTATPAGTFVISGRVREPGAGGLPNMTLVDTLSGHSATTNQDGNFSVAELPVLHAHFAVTPAGFEPAEVDAARENVDVPVQRIVRLTAGDTVRPGELAPNDLSYTVGANQCSDCRLIRVVVPQPGTVHVHVTWTTMSSRLSLFAEGQVLPGSEGELTTDVPVDTPREVLMYLGGSSLNAVGGHTPFVFETSMR